MRTQVPVLVVGGGPTGLAMALFLARLGVETLVVEQRASTSPLPRATHLSRRTMELFRAAGLEAQIRSAGFEVVTSEDPRTRSHPHQVLPRAVLGMSSLASLAVPEILETGAEELAAAGSTPPFWCGQDRIEPILLRGARAAGADIRFEHQLVSLSCNDDGALATIRGPQGPVQVTARYLVAADGARGQTVERLGIARTGLGTVAHRISMIFRADLDRLLSQRFFMSMIENAQFSGAVMELNDRHRYSAAVTYYPAAGEQLADFTPQRCLSLIRSAIGDDSVPVQLEACFGWQATHSVAASYRRGSAFLIGDAAHLHPPAGGYGSNVGYQDAHNLAWKLAATLAGWAPESLLDSYDAERRPVGSATAEQSLLLDGVAAEQLSADGPCDPRTLLMGYRYDSDIIADADQGAPFPPVFDLSGAPGSRLPHFWLTDADSPVSTLDLCTDGLVLLSADPSWSVAAAESRQELEVPLTSYCPGQPETAGRLSAACGFGAFGAVLARPDGFVAWRRVAHQPLSAAERSTELTTAVRRAVGLLPPAEVRL